MTFNKLFLIDFQTDLIQELLNIICQKKQLKVYHLHVLLHSSIKHLDLSVCNSVINDQILNTLGYRCKVHKMSN